MWIPATVLLVLFVSSVIFILMGWCRGNGKSKNGWQIKSGTYRVIAMFGFNLLLNEVGSYETLYYAWSFHDFKGTPEALDSMYAILKVNQGETIEFFRDPTSNILKVAIIPLFGPRIILKR